jgi:hypothetical protein
VERSDTHHLRTPGLMGMADLTLTTFDWVPEVPRGYVHDLRVR